MEIWKADNGLVERAKKIIEEHRPELATAEIVYIFREKAGKKNGKLTIATARKVAPKENVVHAQEGKPDVDFVIEIGADAWEELSDIQQTAILHHELCHCGYNNEDEGNGEPMLIPHDVEEFSAVVEAHGYYLKDIQDFATKVLETREKEKKAATGVAATVVA